MTDLAPIVGDPEPGSAVMFDGSGYAVIPRGSLEMSVGNRIVFSFKTFSPEGLLLSAGQGVRKHRFSLRDVQWLCQGNLDIITSINLIDLHMEVQWNHCITRILDAMKITLLCHGKKQ